MKSKIAIPIVILLIPFFQSTTDGTTPYFDNPNLTSTSFHNVNVSLPSDLTGYTNITTPMTLASLADFQTLDSSGASGLPGDPFIIENYFFNTTGYLYAIQFTSTVYSYIFRNNIILNQNGGGISSTPGSNRPVQITNNTIMTTYSAIEVSIGVSSTDTIISGNQISNQYNLDAILIEDISNSATSDVLLENNTVINEIGNVIAFSLAVPGPTISVNSNYFRSSTTLVDIFPTGTLTNPVTFSNDTFVGGNYGIVSDNRISVQNCTFRNLEYALYIGGSSFTGMNFSSELVLDNVTHASTILDYDQDALLDYDEDTIYGTDWANPDSDLDLLNDGAEVLDHNTDPLDPDSDNDGIQDGDEYLMYFTDPLDVDSDNDTLDDYTEIFVIGTSPLIQDTDQDGLSDSAEVGCDGCDPLLNDTDGDGLSDMEEVLIYNTHPNNTDTDGDGISDYDEVQNGSNPRDDLTQDPVTTTIPTTIYSNSTVTMTETMGDETHTSVITTTAITTITDITTTTQPLPFQFVIVLVTLVILVSRKVFHSKS